MRRHFLPALILVSVILSLLGLGVLGLIKLNPNRHRARLIQEIENSYNLKLKLGWVYPIVYPGLGVEITDLKLDLTDPSRVRPELFRAESVKLVLDLKALFRRTIKIRDVYFFEPEIFYELGPADKERLRNLAKSKSEQVSGAKALKTNGLWWARVLKGIFSWRFSQESILTANRIGFFNTRITVYDFRPVPKRLSVPLEFGDLSSVLESSPSKGVFDFWVETNFPYSEGIEPGPRFYGEGKLFLSLEPFSARVQFDNAEWGDKPLKQLEVLLIEWEEKIKPIGRVAGEFELAQIPALLKFPILKNHQWLGKYPMQGEINYQIRFVPAKGGWEEHLILERAWGDNLKIVLLDPGAVKSKLKDRVAIENIKLEITDLKVSEPAEWKIQFPFPEQELKKSEPLEIKSRGKLIIQPRFSEINFESEIGFWGKNPIPEFGVRLKRVNGNQKYLALGKMRLALDDLSDLERIISWKPLLVNPRIAKMRVSGQGEAVLEFGYSGKYPGFWYEGRVDLKKANYDPMVVIAPVENFSGRLTIAPSQVFTKKYSVLLGEMPVESDFRFSYPGYPFFEFKSQAEEIDLEKLFFSRARKIDPNLKPGAELPVMKSVWEGDFRTQQTRYKNFLAEMVRGHWKYKERILGFSNLTFKYRGGWYQDGDSWVDFSKARVIDFHINGHFDEVQFQKIMEEVFRYDFFVEGKATGNGYLSGRYIDGKLQYDSLDGYFKINMRNGRLRGDNLGIQILQFLGFQLGPRKTGWDFERGKTELVIKKGVVYFEDIEFKSWSQEVHCAGMVDLVNQELKLWVVVYPLEVISTLTSPLPLISSLINQTQKTLLGAYAKANGPWDNIKVEFYLPLLERVPKTPAAPEFPKRPW